MKLKQAQPALPDGLCDQFLRRIHKTPTRKTNDGNCFEILATAGRVMRRGLFS